MAPPLWRGVHCIPRLASGRSVVLSAVQCRSCASSAGDGSPAPVSPKIEALVEQISALTLLEAAELTDALKERLGISSAMMMPAAGGGGPAAGAAAPAEEEEAAPAKTVFTVRLEKFEASSKIKLIKEVRAIAGLGLKESKELVENLPKDVKVDVKEEEANELKVPCPPLPLHSFRAVRLTPARRMCAGEARGGGRYSRHRLRRARGRASVTAPRARAAPPDGDRRHSAARRGGRVYAVPDVGARPAQRDAARAASAFRYE